MLGKDTISLGIWAYTLGMRIYLCVKGLTMHKYITMKAERKLLMMNKVASAPLNKIAPSVNRMSIPSARVKVELRMKSNLSRSEFSKESEDNAEPDEQQDPDPLHSNKASINKMIQDQRDPHLSTDLRKVKHVSREAPSFFRVMTLNSKPPGGVHRNTILVEHIPRQPSPSTTTLARSVSMR